MKDKKEERILITKCSSSCHALHVAFGPVGDEENMYCDKSGAWVIITEKDCAKCKSPVLVGLSRAEAVERMAKAINKERCRPALKEDVYWQEDKKELLREAEAANYAADIKNNIVKLETLLEYN